jgi:hypothetical protein
MARNHQRSRAILLLLRNVCACVEQHAHALDVALLARMYQRSRAILVLLRDVCACVEERSHAFELALLARHRQRHERHDDYAENLEITMAVSVTVNRIGAARGICVAGRAP